MLLSQTVEFCSRFCSPHKWLKSILKKKLNLSLEWGDNEIEKIIEENKKEGHNKVHFGKQIGNKIKIL